MPISLGLGLDLAGQRSGALTGEQLLTGFDYYYTTQDLTTAAQQTLPNRGTGTGVLTLGSTDTVDTNDPAVVAKESLARIWLPATGANYVSTPDSAALDIVGDLDVRARIGPYTIDTVQSMLVGKDQGGGQASWDFYVMIDNTLRFYWSPNGSSYLNADSTATITKPVVGEKLWVRATIDVDNGASGRTVTFYTSADGSSWTQLGSPVTTAGVTSIFSSTSSIDIGRWVGTSEPFSGTIYAIEVRNGIGGTVVASLDVENDTVNAAGSAITSAVTGEVWTITRSATGLAASLVPAGFGLLVHDGVDNYLQLPAGAAPTFTATTGSFTVIYAGKWALTGATYGRIWSSEAVADKAMFLTDGAGTGDAHGVVAGASSAVYPIGSGSGFVDGQNFVAAMIVDAGTVTVWAYGETASAPADITGVGAFTHAAPRIGSSAASVAGLLRTGMAVIAQENRALTPADLNVIGSYLLNGMS